MNYIEIIEKNKNEMIEFLQDLMRIRSVKTSPFKTKEGEIYPFGKGVQDAYQLMMQKAESFGMLVTNVDNYGGHIDMPEVKLSETSQRKKPLMLGILGHLDVVPAEEKEGSGWKHGPFDAVIDDGVIYGRGSLDDKGPVVAVLYAMRALKESGFKPKKNIRLIVGLDEESGWIGMDYYKKHEKMPDFGFSPDSNFPVINGEKGIINFEIAKKFATNNVEGIELRNISGGAAPNVVPDKARALIRAKNREAYDHIREKAKEFEEKTGKKIYCKGVGKSFEIYTKGIASHAAIPEKGENAISTLMAFLAGINFANEDFNQVVDFYNRHIGYETDGKSLNIKMADKESGGLTVNVGQVIMDRKAIRFLFNVRYPVSRTHDEIYDQIIPLAEKYNMGIVKTKFFEPIYISPEDNMVQTLCKVYSDYSGDTESKPFVIGGGSYARAMDNCVCFGALYPEDEDTMHMANESITVDRMMDLAKIYAQAIYELSKEEDI